ncbi:MFS transporter [Microbacterium sp. MYb62]|uniref:MFS transporter n=1 Tax=Microbacterium sp. MYb62 TaxID=1848690 RepID=UPI000CFADE0F|nr:MFS transporter [Microbacterium sp. MYb62]PRB18415.1 hypothetical protein CQ042_03770 [Microbacterium sp. MYb62]
MTRPELRADLTAALAAAVVLTGVQGFAPALPLMRVQLGLSDLEISLLIVGYLLPGALCAFPIGIVADRAGLARTVSGALIVFGICGVLAYFWHDLGSLLAIRAVQGAMFGGVLALTIIATGAAGDTQRITSAQSRRVVIMTCAEGVAPLAAGIVLVNLSWNSVFLLQAVALPVAVLCCRMLPKSVPGARRRVSTAEIVRASRRAVFSFAGAAVQAPGFLRFFLKYALLTFVPLLAATTYGLDPLEIGVMLALASLAGACMAAAAPWFARGTSVGTLLGISLTLTALPIVLVPVAGPVGVLALLVVLTGAGDGLLAVVNNVVVTRLAPGDGKAAFIGLTGGIRSAGKLSAPLVAGLLAEAIPLGLTLASLGVLGLTAIAVVPTIARLLDGVDDAP